MKALIVIEIPEDHLAVTLNDLYERLKGYKCDLKPMPEKKEPSIQLSVRHNDEPMETLGFRCTEYENGWNDCLMEIEK